MEPIMQVFVDSVIQKVVPPILMVLGFFVSIIILRLLIEALIYKKSTYAGQTGKSFIQMRFNLGNYGEYLTYKYLSANEKEGAKFLFNVYLPKDNGETTEIDLVMLAKSGIYVFESKNYSGWIFGSEKAKNWTQSLPEGKKSRKETFFNPVMQNKLHIKCLKNVIGNIENIYSVIVFSERCTLKKIEVSEETAYVIKRDEVKSLVKKIKKSKSDVLSAGEIQQIYEKLLPATQMDESVKKEHIDNIKIKKDIS